MQILRLTNFRSILYFEEMATPPAVKRLQQDLKRLQVEPLVGAMAQPANDKDIMVWHGIVVGTAGTSLAGIPIRFCLEFPNDYPTSPPNGFFETDIYYKNGLQIHRRTLH